MDTGLLNWLIKLIDKTDWLNWLIKPINKADR